MNEIGRLVVFNDDIHSFDDIITCLHEYCDCNEIQAEQLAYIIHHKGKAVIKVDLIEILRDIKESLELHRIECAILEGASDD